MGCFSRKQVGEFRTVYVNNQCLTSQSDVVVTETHKPYANNIVVTSKYEYWNFLPKNIFEQFRRVANFYFLCIVIVQFIILDRTPVSPATSLMPLTFVIVVTAIKQFYEDLLRKRADREVNNREAIIVRDGADKTVRSKDIEVGDIVKVNNNEEIPCDLVVLSSSDPEGKCYIMTANLDGETNLKTRTSLQVTCKMQDPINLGALKAVVECDHPEFDMYKFNGRMIFHGGSGTEPSVHSLSISNLLLRGGKIKQTDFAYGVAVYTGKETKMALNQKDKTYKFSVIEKKMNVYLIFYLLVLLVIAAAFSALKFKWEESNKNAMTTYLQPFIGVSTIEVIVNLLSFLILFNYIIPISLYVTIELQKFCGAQFFNWDLKLYHEPTDDPAKANTSDLIEELGQIEYIFSDKTGTLTENDMQFRQCSVDGIRWEELNGNSLENSAGERVDKSSVMDPKMRDFFVALALCHTVQADEEKFQNGGLEESDGVNTALNTVKSTTYTYQASSPDEKALCEAAANYGIVYKGNNGDYMELEVSGTDERYKILHVLEFDSTRKRMSIILEQESNKNEVLMLCKGAESHILPRCISGPTQETLGHIDEYAKLGLRTLAITSRRIPMGIYKDIDARLTKAQQSISDREQQLEKVFDEVENDLVLLGATAVEDKLQDKVKETIESLREAGIKVWVLTGDKQETAVNISHSCGHFDLRMNIEFITQKNTLEEAEQSLFDVERKLDEQNESGKNEENALVVDGSTIAQILINNDAKDVFIKIARQCSAVLCCRMSPLQKAQVVRLVKTCKDKPITLAIGDGANDCSMIQEANVGCGIMGKEGRQAVRCSDYAFHRFKFLKRVLLVHGHYYYNRLANTVQYFFYKNVVFMVPQIMYQVLNGFSTLPLYSSIFLTCFNIIFTSMPILFYGIFEKDLKPKMLDSNPKLYRDIAKNKKLSWRMFFLWLLSGIWHGVVIYYGVKRLYGLSSFSSSHVDYGLFSFGTFVFTLVVLVVNLKMALITHFWTWFMHLFIWGSIAVYIAVVLVICGFSWPWPFLRNAFNLPLDMDLYWVIYTLFESYGFWLGIVMLTWVALLPDILVTVLSKALVPSYTDSCKETEYEEELARGNQVGDAINSGFRSSTHSVKEIFESDGVQLLSTSKIHTTTV